MIQQSLFICISVLNFQRRDRNFAEQNRHTRMILNGQNRHKIGTTEPSHRNKTGTHAFTKEGDKMEDAPRYPNHIREEIKRRGYMLHEVAQAIYVSERALYNYCAGRRVMPRSLLEALAAFLECPLTALVNDIQIEQPAASAIPSTAHSAPPSLPLNRRQEPDPRGGYS
jgi:ribosome-binding protein aMBF1 (putative translation factor)